MYLDQRDIFLFFGFFFFFANCSYAVFCVFLNINFIHLRRGVEQLNFTLRPAQLAFRGDNMIEVKDFLSQ